MWPECARRVRREVRTMQLIREANLLLRCLLELFALGALGYWGFMTGSATLKKVALGVGAPLVAAVVWGTFLSTRASVQLPWVLVLHALVFGSAAAGLGSIKEIALPMGAH